MRIVPALIRWTQWNMDAAWQEVRRRIQKEAQAVSNQPRHVRAAQMVEFVVARVEGSFRRKKESTGASQANRTHPRQMLRVWHPIWCKPMPWGRSGLHAEVLVAPPRSRCGPGFRLRCGRCLFNG